MHYPRTSRWWAWRTRCADCGLRWPCPDGIAKRVQDRYQPKNGAPVWASWPTQVMPQVGRAGQLTPGQQHRANGRH